MTSDHVLAVMALMREVDTPAKSYRHSLRRAAATATDSPQNDAARAQGERALRDIEQAVRLWVATHPEKSEPAEPSLSPAERTVLRLALGLAEDKMLRRGEDGLVRPYAAEPGFTEDEGRAYNSLKRLAGED